MSIDTSGRGWAKTGLILGGLVSVAANVAHSFIPPTAAPAGWHPQLGAIAFAIVWPVFLFVAIEILARVAWSTGFRWALLRFGGMLPVALVAAFVSYRHLSGLLAFYGEEPVVSTFGPLAVDGLMVMATGALLATGARARQLAQATTPAPDGPVVTTEMPAPTPTVVPAVVIDPIPTHLLPVARFAANNHQQTYGQTITPAELAALTRATWASRPAAK
jgi:hypothetical protein